MAGNYGQIKGITVEISGNTTKLNDALKETNAAAKTTQQELNQINRQLKYDPTNVVLLGQKHEVLAKRIGEVKAKLEILKTAQSQFSAEARQTDEGAAQYRALQREIEKTQGTLQHLETEYQQVDDAAEGPLENIKGKVSEVGSSSENAMNAASVAVGNMVANFVSNSISRLQELVVETIEVGASFETSMAKVASLSGATGADLQNLTNAAKEYGASTQFSATQAADALGYMALAGWDAHDSIDALPGVLNLAAASSMDLAQASDMVTDYLSAFGLSAKDSKKFADEMAYAQANSNTTTTQLGEAFRNCAANMHASGQDVETTTALLGTLANQGLKGSEAGTALSAVMRDITAKMKDGAIQIGDTSVQVVDASGNYRDMSDILKDVETATAGMGTAQRATALQSTFTSDSIKGLNLILSGGVDETNDFEKALRKSDGTAKKMAKTMNDNLNGDVTSLKSKFEGLQIQLYENFEPILRKVVQALGALVDVLSKSGPVMEWIEPIIIGIATALTALLTKLAMVAVVHQFAAAWGKLTEVMTLGANPYILIAAAIAGLIIGLIKLYNTNENFRNFVNSVWPQIQQVFQVCIGAIVVLITELVHDIAAAGTAIFNAIMTVITFIGSIPSTIWGFLLAIINFYISFYTTIFNYMMMLLQAVGSIFGSLWSYASGGVSSFVSSVWSTISGGLSGLGSSMYRWGADMIDGLVRGLRSGIRHVRQAASNLADTIRSYLHFSRPDVGPLRDYESWMPDMVHGLATSLEQAMPELDQVMGTMSGSMAGTVQGRLAGATNNYTNSYGNINIEINAQPGQSAKDIAKEVQKIIVHDIQRNR